MKGEDEKDKILDEILLVFNAGKEIPDETVTLLRKCFVNNSFGVLLKVDPPSKCLLELDAGTVAQGISERFLSMKVVIELDLSCRYSPPSLKEIENLKDLKKFVEKKMIMDLDFDTEKWVCEAIDCKTFNDPDPSAMHISVERHNPKLCAALDYVKLRNLRAVSPVHQIVGCEQLLVALMNHTQIF